jgi:hypothetical protein
MANVQLAVAGDDTTQVILSVPGVQGPTGSSIPPSGTTNQILFKQSNTDYDTSWSFVTSAMIASGTIVNEDVNASAAIAGTKISPNFGSQNVVTTGTSTAASFIPTSSGVPTNGLYLPSANNVAISTNGTGRLFIDSSGNVGIGATPNTTFELTTLNDTANSNPATLRFRDTDTSQQLGQIAGRIQFYSSDNTGPIGVYGEIRGLADGVNGTGAVVIATGTAGSAIEHFRVSNGGVTSLTSDSGTSPLVVNISSTEVARIDSSGRLLVGTSSAFTGTNSQYSYLQIRGNSAGASTAGQISLARNLDSASVVSGHVLGRLVFADQQAGEYAYIEAAADATPGVGDYPGRLVFSVTADGAASPTEALRISSNRAITVSDGGNVVLGTTTGTKIGTATTQKLGFYNATPVVQPAAVADATTAIDVITQLNDLLAKLRTLGIIAT